MPNIKHQIAPGANLKSSAVFNANTLHAIEAGTIVAANIADNAITTNKILDNAVTSTKILNANVTSEKLAEGITQIPASYVIYYKAPTYYARNGATGVIDYSGTDATTVIQNAENAADDTGGVIYLKGVQLPSAVVLSSNVVVIEEYQGIITKYRETSNEGFYVKWFTDEGYGQNIDTPRGLYNNNKTFITYQGYLQNIYAIMYDHNRKLWSEPVYVADNPLSNDDHGAPMIQADNEGYLHIFYGHHTSSSIQHMKSTYAWDISAWTSATAVSGLGSASYGAILKANDNSFYLFARMTDVGKISYVRSTNNMATFGSPVVFVDMGYPSFAAYPSGYAYDSTNNRFFITWYLWDYGDSKNENIYGIWLDLDNGHVYAADGTDYGTLLDKTEADAGYARILDSGVNWAYFPRVHLSGNSIYILYTLGTTYPSWQDVTGWRAKFTRWTGSAWATAVNIINSASENEDFVIDGSTIKAYIILTEPSQLKNRFLDWLAEYSSTDSGATWNLTKVIMYGGETSEGAVYGVDLIQDYNSELMFIFTEHISFLKIINDYKVKLHMYAWGNGGFVYRKITP